MIYKAIVKDTRYKPVRETVVKEFSTEVEVIAYLRKHGGIYKNILHNFECEIKKDK